jgi:hypothetical protein
VGGCGRLHNEELHNFYSSPSIITTIKSRRMRWAGHTTRRGEKWNAYGVLVGKSEGRTLSGRPRHRWEDNIKMDLRYIGWVGMAWIYVGKFLGGCATDGFSKSKLH